MFNDLNSQLNSIVNAQLQAQQQQAHLQNQQSLSEAERSRIRNKYDEPMTWYSLTREVDDLNNLFSKDVQAINNSAPKEITEKAQPHAFLSEIFSKVPAHSQYLSEMQDTIPKSSSMAIADNSWNVLKQKHAEFKATWKKETTAFKQLYKNEIVKLQEGGRGEGDNPNQNLQLEQALVQARSSIVEKDNLIQEKEGVIGGLRDELGMKNNKIFELQGKLLDKTEQITVEHDKYVGTKHKVDLVKVKLSGFINNHEGIEDQEQLVEMLGDLQTADNQ